MTRKAWMLGLLTAAALPLASAAAAENAPVRLSPAELDAVTAGLEASVFVAGASQAVGEDVANSHTQFEVDGESNGTTASAGGTLFTFALAIGPNAATDAAVDGGATGAITDVRRIARTWNLSGASVSIGFVSARAFDINL